MTGVQPGGPVRSAWPGCPRSTPRRCSRASHRARARRARRGGAGEDAIVGQPRHGIRQDDDAVPVPPTIVAAVSVEGPTPDMLVDEVGHHREGHGRRGHQAAWFRPGPENSAHGTALVPVPDDGVGSREVQVVGRHELVQAQGPPGARRSAHSRARPKRSPTARRRSRRNFRMGRHP